MWLVPIALYIWFMRYIEIVSGSVRHLVRHSASSRGFSHFLSSSLFSSFSVLKGHSWNGVGALQMIGGPSCAFLHHHHH